MNQEVDSDDDGIDAFGGPPSVGGASSNSSRPTSAIGGLLNPQSHAPLTPKSPAPLREEMDASNKDIDDIVQSELDDVIPASNTDQTTLLPNEEEGFALAPVDTTTVKGEFYILLFVKCYYSFQ